MIDLNNKDTKDYFNKLIDSEISNINMSLIKQKELNIKLLNSIPIFSSNADTSKISDASSKLTEVSSLLNKVGTNLSSFAKLLTLLRKY
jgi:hypothetical protein